MVVSGINAGSNMGDDVWYSGTVAAAMEGRFMGLPSIAISLVGEHLVNYKAAAMVAVRLIKHLQDDALPAGTILNVNVPDVPFAEIQGYEVTRLGTRHCAEPTIRQLDPRGAPIYWIGPPGKEEDAGPGTDFHALKQKKVSITPLRIDLTQYEAFEQLSCWVGGLENEAGSH
jgi:5'-nucleotidase